MKIRIWDKTVAYHRENSGNGYTWAFEPPDGRFKFANQLIHGECRYKEWGEQLVVDGECVKCGAKIPPGIELALRLGAITK